MQQMSDRLLNLDLNPYRFIKWAGAVCLTTDMMPLKVLNIEQALAIDNPIKIDLVENLYHFIESVSVLIPL